MTNQKTVKVTIRNTFHDTSRSVRLHEGRNVVEKRRLRDWRNALCGSRGCTCSGVGGLCGDMYTPSIVLDGNPEKEIEVEDQCGREGNVYLVIWI